MKNFATIFSLMILYMLCTENIIAQQTVMQYKHPLDPLDSVEIKLIKQVLLQEKRIRNDSSSLFSIINLKEPPKSEVLAYKPGESFRREGYAMVYDFPNNILAKAVVDLKTSKLLSFDKITNKQPVGSFKGDTIVSAIVKDNKEWNGALKKRGINPDSVKSFRGTFAVDIGLAPVGHRERIVSPAYKNKDFYEMPIAGIYAYIDITDKKVLKVIDTGIGYDKPVAVNFFDAKKIVVDLEEPKPIVITQPEGTNYRIEGNQII